MSTKTFIWLGVILGTTIGGFIPTLWGAGWFDLSSIIGNLLGGILGIWLGYKLGQIYGY